MTRNLEAARAATAESSLRDGALAVRLGGWLDGQTLAPLWSRTVSSISSAGIQRLEVDASAVEYCDGAGIALIVELRRQSVERKISVEVRGLKPRVPGVAR
jgi:phospholipid/cholesterol/gamma-HCH transport system permease protein